MQGSLWNGTYGALLYGNPSTCKPSSGNLTHGAVCAYGYQCQSKFCCPRLKVCLTNATTPVSWADIKKLVKDNESQKVFDIVMNDGGTCKDPWSKSSKCMQFRDGHPPSEWDQSQCGCKEEYMKMYQDGTWISMNEGVSPCTGCSESDDGVSPCKSGEGDVGSVVVAADAAGPSRVMPVLLFLLSLLTSVTNM